MVYVEVANDYIVVLLFTWWLITKFYYLIKLKRSNLFRHILEKNNLGGINGKIFIRSDW